MPGDKKLRLYQEYETKTYGRVKLLRYKDASPERQKVCKVGDNPIDYFFISESEIIPHERQRKQKSQKRPPVEMQREFHVLMIQKGYRPKTFYLSQPNIQKLEKLKKKSGLRTWNDFMNVLIEHM